MGAPSEMSHKKEKGRGGGGGGGGVYWYILGLAYV